MRYCRRTKSNMPAQSKSTGDVSTQAGSKRTSSPLRRNWFEATRSSLSIPSQASWISSCSNVSRRMAQDPPQTMWCESRPSTAITLQLIAADQVVGHGWLLGNEPAVAGGRPDLRQVMLVDRRADQIRFRPAVGIEEGQMADFRRQVGRRHAEIMDLLTAALGPAGNQQPCRRLRACGHRPADHRASGVAGIFDDERDFVVRIVLGQQRPQVLFQIGIVSFAGREHEHPAS